MNNTYESFAAAIETAFSTNMANPAMAFSFSKGWYVESAIHPRDEDCVLRIAANYNATTGAYSIGHRDDSKNHKCWEEISEEYGI